jgi:hypothetical protein
MAWFSEHGGGITRPPAAARVATAAGFAAAGVETQDVPLYVRFNLMLEAGQHVHACTYMPCCGVLALFKFQGKPFWYCWALIASVACIVVHTIFAEYHSEDACEEDGTVWHGGTPKRVVHVLVVFSIAVIKHFHDRRLLAAVGFACTMGPSQGQHSTRADVAVHLK